MIEQILDELRMVNGRYCSKCEQICQTLRHYIGSGQLGSGQQLPAERALSKCFATTRITIKEALSSLEADGLIYRAERRGWFVSPPRLTYDPAIHTHFHQWIGEQQRTAETRVLAHNSELASSELCRWMGVEPFTPLYEIHRQRLIDGRPVLHVSHHLLASRFPDIASAPLASSLTELYQQRYGIDQGGSSLEITPSAARGAIAHALNLAEGSAVLRLVRVNYDQRGTLIDCDIEHWRSDAIRIRFDTRAYSQLLANRS
ncbi:UTRA domain-containing protein [Plesiomonas shigelloides]|uniref:UTRA domain-containing protein n=1 Tax=Plesiomonas shigelloides TaxID=703 RepID=UPI001C443A0E|nr:UTRA domain-containing protein [Plesiomonas shigelloides]MCX2499482.1 UTRA domain-containing protein [Plesiomonas shigelloides]MCX2534575.1 UTRA domain-containing protein [Plesiomonas shigelloides]